LEFIELDPDHARLDEAYPVLHELRDHLSLEEFRRRYTEGYNEGYRIVGLFDAGECQAVGGYRMLTNLVHGRFLYIDDLVTTGTRRSRGYGKALNDYLMGVAQNEGCDTVTLDSHTSRVRAHRFYFREGYVITSFHFGRPAFW
jgi:ribosomal protein S18 acetylase RimI-like enzyme